MRKLLKTVMKFIISGTLAVLILSVVAMFYSHTGIHITNPNGSTDYVWEPNQLKSNMTEGFAWFVMDENGYNNTRGNSTRAMEDGCDILLMGSSHMEAVQVPSEQNVGARLNQQLEGMHTYNIGVSGHSIYRVMDNIKDAVREYRPEKYIIIETDSIQLDREEMQSVIHGTATRIPSYDSGLIYLAQKIPAIKWIYKNTQDWVDMQRASTQTSTKSYAVEKTGIDENYMQSLGEFLNQAASVGEDYGCQVIIFYHSNYTIDTDGTLLNSVDSTYLDAFAQACEDKGIVFLDMDGTFREYYEEQHMLPYGFSNTQVGVGHLNAQGHQLIGDKLIEVIMELEGEKKYESE